MYLRLKAKQSGGKSPSRRREFYEIILLTMKMCRNWAKDFLSKTDFSKRSLVEKIMVSQLPTVGRRGGEGKETLFRHIFF